MWFGSSTRTAQPGRPAWSGNSSPARRPVAAMAADRLNRQDVAIVQHEYGIYGGADGDDVLRVLALLSVPAIVVLHTVLTTPTAHQRFVLDGVVAAAAAVVVMSETARSRLVNGYDVPAHRVVVIPHGAPDAATAPAVDNGDRGQILTWGLLGPGKGIEWGIEAMALLGDMSPEPRYVVAGRTHPKVLAHQGERYRRALIFPCRRARRARPSPVRRALPRRRLAACPGGPHPGRPAALRFPRPGHLRSARRGGHRAHPRRGDPVPACRRTARRRRRCARRPSGSGGDREGGTHDSHRQGRGGRDDGGGWSRRPIPGLGGGGRPVPRGWPSTSSDWQRRWWRETGPNRCAAGLPSSAAHVRRRRPVRARLRLSCRAASTDTASTTSRVDWWC